MARLMAPRSPRPKPGPRPLYVELSEDLSLDLAAFCKAHYNAPQIQIIREALREHIDSRLAQEPAMRQRFTRARDDLRKQASEPIRIVERRPKKSTEPGQPEEDGTPGK
jgi:hypothetical protein